MDEALEATNVPGIVLLVAGALNVLFAMGMFIWSGFSLLLSIGGIGTGVLMALDTGEPTLIISGVIGALSPIIQLIAYVIVGIMGCISILGGLRLRSCRSRGVVVLGGVSAPLGPVLVLLASFTSFCNCNCFGTLMGVCPSFILGNVVTLLPLLVGTIAAILTFMTLSKPEVAAAFAENA